MVDAEPGQSILSQARGLLSLRNIRVLALTGFLSGTYLSILNAILQPFVVKELGFTVAILGILVSLGNRPLGVASSAAQPFGGILADLLGRRRLVMTGSLIAVCSMVSFLVASITRSLFPLGLGFLFLGASLLGNPATQAIVAETVALDKKKLSVAFSLVFFFTALPGAVFPFTVGYLVESIGYSGIFIFASILESVNLATMLLQLKETQSSSTTEVSRRMSESFRGFLAIPPRILAIFIPFAMDAFSWGLAGAIIYGMWSAQFHFTDSDIGLIVGVLSIAVVLGQYPATQILLISGTRVTLALSELLTVFVMAGWILSSSPLVYASLAVVFGFAVSLWVPASSALLMSAAPESERGGISGKLAAVRGLAFVSAPVIGGLLFSTYGYYVPVFLGMVGECFTTVTFLKLIPRG